MADEETGVPPAAGPPGRRSSTANLILVLLVFVIPLALIFLYELALAVTRARKGIEMSTSTRRPRGRPWWESRNCSVCRRVIGRLRFWQEKPRLLAGTGDSRDVRYLKVTDVQPLLADHLLVCGDCYFNRYGDSLATAQRRRAGTRRSRTATA